MIDYTDISIKEFERSVDLVFPDMLIEPQDTGEIIKSMGRISFSRFARCDSLYFSLSHALRSSKIGLEILNSIKYRSGLIKRELAINFMASVLFCNIGIIKGILDEDGLENYKVSDDQMLKLTEANTDSILWLYKSYRSCQFLESISFLNTHTNMALVSKSIEYSDFSITEKSADVKVGVIDKYNRATQIISLMAESNQNRTLAEYYYSAKEANVIDEDIFQNLGDFKEKWAQYFWDTLYSDVAETILMLRETDRGRGIVSSIYSHL